MRQARAVILLAVGGFAVCHRAAAQVPPSSAEIAAYGGLHAAAERGDGDAISRLAGDGAALDARDERGRTPLHVATFAGQREAVRALARAGASLGLLDDGTALIAAAHLGHDKVVALLIHAGAPLDHLNNLHWTATIEAVVLGAGGPRHQRTLAALIAAGASLELADRDGRTPLALARARGYDAMVRQLVAAGGR